MKLKLFFLLLFVAQLASAQLNIDHYIRVGQTLLETGDFVGSIEDFNIVIKFKPQLPEPYFMRGTAKQQLDDYRGAIEDYSKAIQIKPYYPEAYTRRALAYLQLNDYQSAIEDYDQVLALDPHNEGIYNNRGIAKMSTRDIDGAIADYDKALELNPNFVNAYINLSNAWIAKGDPVNAIRNINKAIIIRPHYAGAYLLRGLARYGLKDYASALRDFDQTLKFDPQNAYAFNNRGLVKQTLGDFKGAIMDYDAALNLNPTLPNAYFNRAIAKQRLDLPGADKDFKIAARLDPSLTTKARQINDQSQQQNQSRQLAANSGSSKGNQGQQSAANQQKAKSNSPNPPQTQNTSGKSSSGNHSNSEEARKRRRFRLSLADTRNIPANNGGTIDNGLVQNRNIEIKLKNIFSIAAFSSKSMDYSKLQYYNLLVEKINSVNNYIPTMSLTNRSTGDYQQIFTNNILYFNDKIKVHKSSDNYLSRGIFKILTEDYNGAMDDLNKAIELDPSNLLAYFSRANCQLQMARLIESLPDFSKGGMTIPVGKKATASKDSLTSNPDLSVYQKIIRDYETCIRQNPKFPFAHYNLAYIDCKLGNYKDALEHFNKAIALQPDFAEAYYNRGLTRIYLDDITGGALDLSKAGELGIEDAYNVIKRYCN